MKKIKERHVDEVKIIGYRLFLALYGVKIVQDKRRYSLEILMPFFDGDYLPVKIYGRENKPLIKNLYLLNLLAFPCVIIYSVLLLLFIVVVFIISFPHQILIRQSFLTKTWEYVSGWIWIAFAVFGMYKCFAFIF